MGFTRWSIGKISLDSAGLVALADLKSISYRTVLTGSASYLDVLVLVPGIHVQQLAPELNGNELPACGAMTTGYVFRVENPAMVAWMQGEGETGHLTTVYVSEKGMMLENEVDAEAGRKMDYAMETIRSDTGTVADRPPLVSIVSTPGIPGEVESRAGDAQDTTPQATRHTSREDPEDSALADTSFSHKSAIDASKNERRKLTLSMKLRQRGRLSSALHFSCCILTIVTIVLLAIIHDWWAVGILAMLMSARFINTAIIRRRAVEGWKGVPEPGVKSDLLILLSQDRWFRMRGLTDDVKAVTAGNWLREMNSIESSFASLATLLVFGAAALAANSSTVGSLMIALLLLISVGLLGMSNNLAPGLCMYERYIQVVGERRKFQRRLDLVRYLVAECKNSDWAVAMGLIKSEQIITQV